MYSGSLTKNNISKGIHDWAYGIVGEEERVLPIIKDLLTYVGDVTILWKENQAYQELSHAKIQALANCNAFGSLDNFNKLIQGSEYKEKMDMLLAQGENPATARKRVFRYFAILADLEIHEPQAFEAFYQELNRLLKIQGTLEGLKMQIVLENSDWILSKCFMMDLIRTQNAVYRGVIGMPVQVENILGPNGEKLKGKDFGALSYVFGLEQEETELDNRRTVIELNQRGRV